MLLFFMNFDKQKGGPVMNKSQKTINHNTLQNDKQKFVLSQVLREPMRKQSDPKYIRAVAEDIVRWAQTPEALTLEAFYVQLQVSDNTVENWGKKYKFLADAVQRAKMIIGIRREKGLITGKYSRYVASTLHHYLKRCKESAEWHAELKKRDFKREERGKITWVIETIPETGLVPPKKIEQ
jgi:hypothetical protein